VIVQVSTHCAKEPRLYGNLATVEHPLNDLLRQNVMWSWTADCEVAFHWLKEQLKFASFVKSHSSSFIRSCSSADFFGYNLMYGHDFVKHYADSHALGDVV